MIVYGMNELLRFFEINLRDVYQFLGNRVRVFSIGPDYQLGPDFV